MLERGLARAKRTPYRRLMSDSKTTPYLHGYSSTEQERLIRQAAFAEQKIFRDVDFSESARILEVGCGVGAQSEILLRRFPKLKIMGIDYADAQLATLEARINAGELSRDRFEFQKMNAMKMDFADKSFDGAFLCWVLEHIPDPQKVLHEVRRVLREGSVVWISEVLNASFFLDPYSPHTWKYWSEFNDFQFEKAGDPFVGAKLGNMLLNAGFRDIQTRLVSWHLDNREPAQRRRMIEYWTELLFSASPTLLENERVTQATVDGMKRELEAVSEDPNAVFIYSFVQAQARR